MPAGFGGLKKKSYVVIGDSIPLGVRTGVTMDQTAVYLIGAAKGYVPMRNSGRSSDTSVDVHSRFEPDCLAYGPTGICIGNVGTNDPGAGVAVGAVGTAGSYTDNISKDIVKGLITSARITLWVPILAQDATLNAAIAPYRTAMRGLAVTYGCDLFDLYNDMAALDAATQNSLFIEAAGSGVHFSPFGNAWAAGKVGSGAYANSFLSA